MMPSTSPVQLPFGVEWLRVLAYIEGALSEAEIEAFELELFYRPELVEACERAIASPRGFQGTRPH